MIGDPCVQCGRETLRAPTVGGGRQSCTTCAPAVDRARGRAHAALDALWRSGLMTRTQAYEWLHKRMRLPEGEAHVRMFNVDQCERVVGMVRTSLGRLASRLLAADLFATPPPEPRPRPPSRSRSSRRSRRR